MGWEHNGWRGRSCIYSHLHATYLREAGSWKHWLHNIRQPTRITTSFWTIIDRKTIELTKNDTPHTKTKEKPQWDGMRGAITVKSNPITAGWVMYRLENIYTTEVHPLEWRFWAPRQFPNLVVWQWEEEFWENQTWRPVRFDCRTSTGLGKTVAPLLEGTQKVVCTMGPRGRSSDPRGDRTRPTC